MGGDVEYGICQCCGKEAELKRTVFHYPGVKCECHGPHHFEMKAHCKECTPQEPVYSKVEFKTDDLKKPASIAVPMLRSILDADRGRHSLYEVWKANIACAVFDVFPQNVDADPYKIANDAASLFLERLIAK
jgi:hypothetical protein